MENRVNNIKKKKKKGPYQLKFTKSEKRNRNRTTLFRKIRWEIDITWLKLKNHEAEQCVLQGQLKLK